MNRPADTSVRPLRVFVVESHPATLRHYQVYLQSTGHQVQTAASMTQAIAALPKSECDVLISDVGLPDGDGWELMTRLRASGEPCPRYAIAVSGHGTSADRAKTAAAGYRHHLLKPFPPQELDAMLEEAARELVHALANAQSTRLSTK